MSKRTRHIPTHEDASSSGLRRWQRSSFSRVGRAVVMAAALLAVAACAGDDGPTGPGGNGGNGEPEVPDAVPDAGEPQDVARGASITLSGAESSDPDGAALTYTWTQILGPDVTGGDGTLSGENVTVDAPAMVSTLVFTLEVDDGNGTGDVADTVQINVLEHTEGAFWVNGDAGSDTDGTGTRNNPYATISGALSQVNGADQDIYVMTRSGGAAYEESGTLEVPTSISLYGGYDENWRRDVVGNRTLVHGAATAIDVGPVEDNAWVSGFRIVGSDATEAGEDAFGIRVVGGSGAITVEDNDVRSGSAGNAATDGAAGSSYGVLVFGGELARVRRNAIEAGAGGHGADGGDGSPGAHARVDGSDADEHRGGSRGAGGGYVNNGGSGGHAGTGFSDDGDDGGDGQGPDGGAGGDGDPTGSGSAASGGGGGGGDGGAGGFPGVGQGGLSDDGFFRPGAGTSGEDAEHGSGGGGGGGGQSTHGLDGGGGGGGGGGGFRGSGGSGGGGGGASVGLLLHDVADAQVEDNEIVSSAGGLGASGGSGGIGGNGSNGGEGAPRKCALGCSGAGAHGGGGGKGGQGGSGGGGAGGPSYGILVGPGIAPTIRGNTVTSGRGGAGGAGGGGGLAGRSGGAGSTANRLGGSSLREPRAESNPAGGGGFSYAVFDLDIDDGFAPALQDNSLTPGTAGEGASGLDDDHRGAVGESGPTNN